MINYHNYYQYQPPVAMFSMAQFGFYDWVGRKGADLVDWQINTFDKRNPRYYNDPGFKASVDDTVNRVNQVRTDPVFRRTVGKRITKYYGVGGLGLAAVGAGYYFLRRRQSKNGKTIIERVRKG